MLTPGTGKDAPDRPDEVKVHYTGWTTDGKMFDSSVMRGQPATFPLKGVIAGWTEGVQLMVEGEKRRFWIPEELAYKGQPGAPAGHAGVRRRAAQDRRHAPAGRLGFGRAERLGRQARACAFRVGLHQEVSTWPSRGTGTSSS